MKRRKDLERVATTTLVALAQSGVVDPEIRLQAARELLDHAGREQGSTAGQEGEA